MSEKTTLGKILDKLKNYWLKNLEAEQKKLSGGFGAMIITIIGALGLQLTTILSGNPVSWGVFLITSISAITMFLIMLVQSLTGKEKITEEIPS